MKIMIDAGHGGSDTGAIGINVKEKNMNLEVALCLQKILHNYKIDAELTRYQDTSVSLADRCNISNLYKADLFISIHHNASNGKAKGYEIYHFEKSMNGKKLAELVDEEFAKLSTKRYVGDKEMGGSVSDWNYYVLEHTNSPAVLTEFCFIDNLEDLKLYHPQRQAQAIANAVFKFFDIKVEEIIKKEITIDEALRILQAEKVIESPNYWKNNLDKLEYLDKLIINMAKRLKN